MSWKYSQATGALLSATGALYRGYSGAKPDGVNNPMMQNVANVGPIPQGVYEIEAPIDTEAHGPYGLPLIPSGGNQMFGRSGFLIHGDSLESPGSASEGCVIMPRAAREAIWASGDHILEVI